MIILRINRYVTRLLSGLSEHRRILRRKDDWANRMISQWQTNRDSSSTITISSLNRKWIEHKRNLTNGSPEQSRILRWTMIWRYNNTSQLCTEDFMYPSAILLFTVSNDRDIRTVVLFIKTSTRRRSMSILRDILE